MSSRVIEHYSPFLSTLSQVSWDSEHEQSLVEDDDKSHRVYNFDGIAKNIARECVARRICHVMLTMKKMRIRRI